MPEHLSIDNIVNFHSSSKYKPEVPYMITEGRAEHIDAIAEEIERYEKWEPRWDIQKNMMSFFGAIFLSGAGILIGEANLEYKFLISFVTAGSFSGFIVCLISIWSHHKDNKERYAFQAQKLKNIMIKVRQSVG